jgi:hypothetical protein
MIPVMLFNLDLISEGGRSFVVGVNRSSYHTSAERVFQLETMPSSCRKTMELNELMDIEMVGWKLYRLYKNTLSAISNSIIRGSRLRCVN